MKAKLRLEPVNPNSFVQALFFDDKSKKYVLLQNGAYVETPSLSIRDKDGSLREVYRPDTIKFGIGTPYIDLINDKSDLYKFWSRHPNVLFADNKANNPGDRYNKDFVGNIGSPLAYIVDDDVVGLSRYDDVKDICEAYNFLVSSDARQLEDLFYYIGISPKAYSNMKVAVGDIFGYDKPILKETVDKILEYANRKERGNSDEVWAYVVFNKAKFGEVLKFSGDGYYFDNKFIGNDEAVLSKLIGDKDFSDAICKAIGIEDVDGKDIKRGRRKRDDRDEITSDDIKI